MHAVPRWDPLFCVCLLNSRGLPVLVGVVQFVHVQAIAAVVRVVVVSGLLDCRGAVALLGVKLSAVRSVCAHWIQVVLPIRESIAGWVVAKVGLVHQLLIEAGGDRHILACRAGGPRLLPLEELSEDEFLLVSHAVNVYPFALDCSIKCVVLALTRLTRILVATRPTVKNAWRGAAFH